MVTKKSDTVDTLENETLPEDSVTENETVSGETQSETTGVRARRAFMCKNFVPSIDWIMKNIVSQGKGSRAMVGRIYGAVTGYTDKVNEIQGVPTPSIALNGSFEAMNYIDGEVSRFVTAFLPMAYAEQLKAAFLQDPDLKLAEIDLDVGLEATGKTIPYEWIIVAHIEGQEVNALKRIRNSRKLPTFALTGPGEQLKLASPTKG